jgi:hypothetical protein
MRYRAACGAVHRCHITRVDGELMITLRSAPGSV